MDAFPIALKHTLKFEGGLSNHPLDPGGPTWAGLSLKAVERLDGDQDGTLDFDLDGDGDVDRKDIEALAKLPEKERDEKIAAFYRRNYWDAVRGSELPARLAVLTFDAAVLHGPSAAVLLLQRAIGGLKQDGQLGAATLAAAWNAGLDTADRLLAHRAFLMYRIVQARPSSETFLLGWFRRLFMLDAAVSALRAQ